MKIYNTGPTTWQGLEIMVREVFNDMGCIAVNQRTINTVRGDVNVDVIVEDYTIKPKLIYLCECKYWNTEVPKYVIHSFRTVVSDYGAHCGFIISKSGFQAGAYEAILNSNLFLFTWDEFLSNFEDRWLETMVNQLHNIGEPVRNYCNPISTFFLEQFNKLTVEEREDFEEATNRFRVIATYSFKDWYLDTRTGTFVKSDAITAINYVITKVLKEENRIKSYKDFFSFMFNFCKEGTQYIDNLLKQPVRKNKT